MTLRRYLPALFVIGLILWGTFLFAAVGITQRRFYAEAVVAVLRHLWAIGVAGGIALAGLGIGADMVRLLKLRASDAEQWLAAALMGIGTLAAVWLTIGLVLTPPLPVTLLLLAVGWWRLWKARPPVPPLPPLSRGVGIVVVAFMGLSLVQALRPATAFDAMLYHLRLPELWLATGNLYPTAIEPQFYFPVLIDTLFAIAMQLSGESAAQIVHWVALPINLLLLWQISQRFLPRVSVGMVWLLALSIQMLPLLASWAYTDVYLALFQVGVVWALLRWRDDGERTWVVVAGVCAGLALGVKYLALFTPILAAVMIVVVARRQPLHALRTLLLFGAVALVVALPSYVRNTIGTGNPIFPFLLPSAAWDDFRADWYALNGTGIGTSIPDILTLPYAVTIGQGDANYIDGRPGLLIITFLPLALLALWRIKESSANERKVLYWLLFFVGSYTLIWLAGVMNSSALRQGRFLLPPLLLLCPVVAWGLTFLPRFDLPTLRVSFLARVFVGAWVGFALFIAIAEFATANPDEALLRPATWQQERWGAYSEAVDAVTTLSPESRTLLWFEPRSYRMPATVYPDTIVVQFMWRLRNASGNLTYLNDTLCQEGYTHILLYQRGADFVVEDREQNPNANFVDGTALQAWQRYHRLAWQDAEGWYKLYELGCEG